MRKIRVGQFVNIDLSTFITWQIGDNACNWHTLMKKFQNVRQKVASLSTGALFARNNQVYEPFSMHKFEQ